MSLVRRLKPDRNIIGAMIPLSMLPIVGVVSLIYCLLVGFMVLALLTWAFGLFYLYVFVRTGNGPHLFVSIYAAFLGYMFFIARDYITVPNSENVGFRLAYFTGIAFFGFGLIYLTLTRRLKWRGREIFELAAEPV